MRNAIVKATNALLVVLVLSSVAMAQTAQAPRAGGRQLPDGYVADGVPKMPNPPGPAPKQDLSGAWVGPQNNKPDPVPPMTPAGQAVFKTREAYLPERLPGRQPRSPAHQRPVHHLRSARVSARPSGARHQQPRRHIVRLGAQSHHH